jgi:hypothetical protein
MSAIAATAVDSGSASATTHASRTPRLNADLFFNDEPIPDVDDVVIDISYPEFYQQQHEQQQQQQQQQLESHIDEPYLFIQYPDEAVVLGVSDAMTLDSMFRDTSGQIASAAAFYHPL